MRKLVIVILVVLAFVDVNAQELKNKIEFTAISSIDSKTLFFGNNTYQSIETKEIKISINKIEEKTIQNQKLPNVRLFNYYEIAENVAITTPDWEFENVDAFGFKLCLYLK